MPKNNFSQEDVEYIYNLLRQGTIKWPGRAEALKKARKLTFVKRAKSSGKPIYKLKWQCAKCMKWFRNEQSMEVDHIVEIGGVTSFNGDWNEMIFKIMPRPVDKHLQVLCGVCHKKKTHNYMNAAEQWQRKK